MNRVYCVYILVGRSRNLYTGVTNDLDRRMLEHRQGLIPGFTSRYRIFRLVHFERLGSIHEAIAREKEIKGWRRDKKIALIERHNPTWRDLAEHLPNHYGPNAENSATSQTTPKADPSRWHADAVPDSG